MSKYDYAKRIKALVRRECTLERLEAKATITAEGFMKDVEQLQSTLLGRKKIISKFNEQIEKMQDCNESLQKFIDEEEIRMEQSKENVKKMGEELKRKLAAKENHRSMVLDKIDRLRVLKQATKTFVDIKSLDTLIKGFHTCELENSTELIPLNMKREDFTLKEIQNYVWHETQRNTIDTPNKIWHKLFFGDSDIMPLLQDQYNHQSTINNTDFVIID